MGNLGVRRRFIILRRDNFCCRYCRRHASEVELEVDHIEPRKCALLAHQSTFAPERLTTGAHLRISLWINFPNSAGATRTILFDCRIMGEDLSDSLPRFQNAKPSQNMRAVMNARDPSPV